MLPKSKARSHLILQAIGLGYVGYLIFQLVTSYIHGESDIEPKLFILIVSAMTVIEVVLAVFAVRAWKRDRKKELEGEENSSE